MLPVLILPFVAALLSQDAPATSHQPLELGLYEVRDLAERFGRDHPAPRLGAPRPVWTKGDAGSGAPVLADVALSGSVYSRPEASSEAADEATRIATGARVIEATVARLLTPKSTDPAHVLRCSREGTLVLNGSAAQHAWLDAFLGNLRSHDKWIAVEARFVRVSGARLEELGIEGHSAFPEPEEVPSLLEALKQSPGVEFVSAPRVLALPLQRACISTLEHIRFVGDWRVETVEPGAQELLVPLVQELDTGLVLDVRAIPLPGGTLALSVEAQEARLSAPLTPVETTLRTKAGDKQVAVVLPEVGIQRVQTELLLQDGSTALLVVDGPSRTKERQLVVVVSARSVAAK